MATYIYPDIKSPSICPYDIFLRLPVLPHNFIVKFLASQGYWIRPDLRDYMRAFRNDQKLAQEAWNEFVMIENYKHAKDQERVRKITEERQKNHKPTKRNPKPHDPSTDIIRQLHASEQDLYERAKEWQANNKAKTGTEA